ncbi:hypothetical protein PCANB_000306 [Pneumocystis canis]|nr:hypothetical protein PCK1_000433 [Pneumocystis canis]KAG5437960.1 hypothetical protein PCANB_000306 [Pneumocystis canis]
MSSRVELSITKLLLATKQLLEVLNEWSHGTAEEHDVSDIYVKLGNEFNSASAAFLSEKIDISDLASIPEDLRVILESTLAEEASPEALEHYLPRIRAIIINLLQGLKRKQAEYRARIEHVYITPHKQQSTLTPHLSSYVSSSSSDKVNLKNNLSSGTTSSDEIHLNSLDMISTSSHNLSSSFLTAHPIIEKRASCDVSSSPFSDPRSVAPTPIVSSSNLSSPYPLSSTNESATSTHQWSKNHTFSSLKCNDNLEKGPNKRYSTYAFPHVSMDHTSPLQNISQTFTKDKKSNILKEIKEKDMESKHFSQNGQSSSILVHNDLSTKKNTNTCNPEKFLAPESPQNHLQIKSEPVSLTLFLQFGSQVKKVILDKNITPNNLQTLFIEKFQFNSDMDKFPPLYIQDTQTKIFYELEDTQDIVNHSLISLKIQDEDISNKALEDGLSSLTKEFQSLKTSIEGQKEMISEITSRPSTCLSKSTIDSLSKQENTFPRTPKDHSTIVKNIRQELDALRSIYTDFTLSMKLSMLDIDKKAKKIKNIALEKLGGSRQFIDLGKKKIETETLSLVTKIENLSDIVSNLRIDVINRKVRPSSQQLDNVRKEETQIQRDISSLTNHLENLSPCWRQLWETELQNVVEEQEFLTHQENFIEDLKSDIAATMEVFGNIVAYSEYQEKGVSRSIHSMTTNSTDSLNTFQSETRNTKLSSEAINDSINKKLGQRETHFMFHMDKFKNELNEFIAGTKFKKIGCMDDVERFRKEKDNLNLKEIYFFLKHSKKEISDSQNEIKENNLLSIEITSFCPISTHGSEIVSKKSSEEKISNKDNPVLTSEMSNQLEISSL